jgi:hypothetical protein
LWRGLLPAYALFFDMFKVSGWLKGHTPGHAKSLDSLNEFAQSEPCDIHQPKMATDAEIVQDAMHGMKSKTAALGLCHRQD